MGRGDERQLEACGPGDLLALHPESPIHAKPCQQGTNVPQKTHLFKKCTKVPVFVQEK